MQRVMNFNYVRFYPILTLSIFASEKKVDPAGRECMGKGQ